MSASRQSPIATSHASRSSKVPALVAEYFGSVVETYHPTINQAFRRSPVGTSQWQMYPIKKRVTISWLRKMKAEGFTAVSLKAAGRVADFDINEILKHQAREDRAPMFPGRLI
jgi:hypothetical protein